MAPRQSKTAKRTATQNKTRSIESEVFKDSQARNRLGFTSNQTEKSRVRKPSKKDVKKEQSKIRLYGVKRSRGKKGKKFVNENPEDSTQLNRIINEVILKDEKRDYSKLEKAQKLEEIRELKKKEIEQKEAAKRDKLEDKKQEIKNKATKARTDRRKRAKLQTQLAEEEASKPKKKKVAFA
ncbi:unnamed protein product [Wickerhamomyces anomalus]